MENPMKLVCFGLKGVMKDTYHNIHVMKGCLFTSLFCFEVWHLLQARSIIQKMAAREKK